MFVYIYFFHKPTEVGFLYELTKIGFSMGVERLVESGLSNLGRIIMKTNKEIAMSPDSDCVVQVHCDRNTYEKIFNARAYVKTKHGYISVFPLDKALEGVSNPLDKRKV